MHGEESRRGQSLAAQTETIKKREMGTMEKMKAAVYYTNQDEKVEEVDTPSHCVYEL